MTKKDYIRFAQAISTISNPSERGAVAATVAKVCQSDNPAFSLSIFYSACNVDYKTVDKK